MYRYNKIATIPVAIVEKHSHCDVIFGAFGTGHFLYSFEVRAFRQAFSSLRFVGVVYSFPIGVVKGLLRSIRTACSQSIMGGKERHFPRIVHLLKCSTCVYKSTYSNKSIG